jgi:hypothetical protein
MKTVVCSLSRQGEIGFRVDQVPEQLETAGPLTYFDREAGVWVLVSRAGDVFDEGTERGSYVYDAATEQKNRVGGLGFGRLPSG